MSLDGNESTTQSAQPSQTTPARVSEHRSKRDGVRYCDHCGAQVKGPGAWGCDNDCPKKIWS